MPFRLNMMEGGTWTAAELLSEVGDLEDLGVTWLTLTLPGGTRGELLDEISRSGNEILTG